MYYFYKDSNISISNLQKLKLKNKTCIHEEN